MEGGVTDEQLSAAWKKIDSMQPGEILVISKIAPNKPDAFIECCKKWIDCFKNGQFSNDYKMFKKLRNG